MQSNVIPRGPLAWRTAGGILARLLGGVPRSRRFAVAAGLARVLAQLVRRSGIAAQVRPSHLDTPAATALSLILSQLHRSGSEFSVPLGVRGEPELLRPRDDGRGLILVGPYSALNPLLIRFLYEQNPRIAVVTALDGAYEIIGTPEAAPCIPESPQVALRVRKALGEGRAVAVMAQQFVVSRRALEIATEKGPMLVPSGIFQLAARCGARLCFAAVHLDRDGTVRIELDTPPAQGRSFEADFQRYSSFVQRMVGSAAPE